MAIIFLSDLCVLRCLWPAHSACTWLFSYPLHLHPFLFAPSGAVGCMSECVLFPHPARDGLNPGGVLWSFICRLHIDPPTCCCRSWDLHPNLASLCLCVNQNSEPGCSGFCLKFYFVGTAGYCCTANRNSAQVVQRPEHVKNRCSSINHHYGCAEVWELEKTHPG